MPESSDASSNAPPTAQSLIAQELKRQEEWTKQRIERRMHNETQRQVKVLTEIIDDAKDRPMHLNAIYFQGANATRTSFLRKIATPHLNRQSTTLRDILQTSKALSETLEQFGIFSTVEASVDQTQSMLASADDVDLTFHVKEASRMFLRTATEVGDGEGGASITARLKNAFGGAESLEANATLGTRTKSSFQIMATTPLFADPFTTATLLAFSAERDLKHFASCRESVRGLKFSLKTPSSLGTHDVSYEALMRNLSELEPTASLSIRRIAGLSVKSSIAHTLTNDTRDDPVQATRGLYYRFAQEIAGMGGDANHFKAEFDLNTARSVLKESTLSIGLRTGLLVPFNKGGSQFLDRFQLGGPTSLRMFKLNSIGLRDSGDYLGGDAMWAFGLSLFSPFPYRPEWPLKTHLFLNFGKLASPSQSASETIKELVTKPVISAGVGIMARQGPIRVEANIGVPLAASRGDGTRKGLQMGIGIHFL